MVWPRHQAIGSDPEKAPRSATATLRARKPAPSEEPLLDRGWRSRSRAKPFAAAVFPALRPLLTLTATIPPLARRPTSGPTIGETVWTDRKSASLKPRPQCAARMRYQ